MNLVIDEIRNNASAIFHNLFPAVVISIPVHLKYNIEIGDTLQYYFLSISDTL
jgi:hypothetical protein